jgi:hypothetical protein
MRHKIKKQNELSAGAFATSVANRCWRAYWSDQNIPGNLCLQTSMRCLTAYRGIAGSLLKLPGGAHAARFSGFPGSSFPNSASLTSAQKLQAFGGCHSMFQLSGTIHQELPCTHHCIAPIAKLMPRK